ncbi:MAG: hypothetical protein ABI824_02880, partial [Acidobacteriota bacterium]
NPELAGIDYRANQGFSNFAGLNLVLRRRSPAWFLQASYTWSHAIDNQSDPLAGAFLDLGFIGNSTSDPLRAQAAFSKQFDAKGDRGNSDFDQRHNLVVLGSWSIPSFYAARSLTGGWRISMLSTVRSGLPFTVFAPTEGSSLINRRANYLGGTVRSEGLVPGGLQWLNASAFAIPTAGAQGNLGRNSLRAAGFYSLDLSLARTLRIPVLGEYGALTIRGDAFNLLNHANLDSPQNVVGSSNFGVALFGRHGVSSAFPASAPLDETPRRIQVALRIEF